ncbi:MAG: hypothetical protein A3K59_06040 [Euryarchaeota archaeon RBG_19FT_COMBO_69_17]|nr:MAG: hypothetical protein A3K59_06040 [Euryarchaeota archaeon RBG_19FT_COMBO_69_17]
MIDSPRRRNRRLRAEAFSSSAWEDERALMAFVRAGAHGGSMAGMRDRRGPTKSARWRVRGSGLPLSWEDGLRRLRE